MNIDGTINHLLCSLISRSALSWAFLMIFISFWFLQEKVSTPDNSGALHLH